VVRVGDEERATDDQFAGASEDAVTVCTYHRAKGLEWPVVVLTSLDRHERRDAFDPCPESDRPGFDPIDPLAGRWIRFWPWPFGQQTQVPLAEAAAGSVEGLQVAERERRERVRLLYVGFTRARDQLVLAARLTAKGAKTDWLDSLQDAAGTPLLRLPTGAADGAIDVATLGGHEVACRVWHPGGQTMVDDAGTAPRRFARQAAPAVVRPSYRITPSRRDAGDTGRGYVVERVTSIGPGIRLGSRADWEQLGTAVHAFLAADPWVTDPALRRATAERIVAGAALRGVLDAADLMTVADGLGAELATRWPDATWQHEVPVTAIVPAADGARRIEGIIDLLGVVAGGVILVDHKTYPAPSLNAVAVRAAELAPQLAIYADALEHVGRAVVGACLHFPLAGAWVDLRRP